MVYFTSINPSIAKHDFGHFNLFYEPIKSMLLGTKYVRENQDLQMLGMKLSKYEYFSHTCGCGSR